MLHVQDQHVSPDEDHVVSLYLYVSVGKQQVHDDVLSEDLRVVNAEFDAGELLRQLLPLVFLSCLPDVIQQRVLVGSTAEDRQTDDSRRDSEMKEQKMF